MTDSGLGAQCTGNRGMVSKKAGARMKLDTHSLLKVCAAAHVRNLLYCVVAYGVLMLSGSLAVLLTTVLPAWWVR